MVSNLDLSANDDELVSGINITPLVDVVLVLLVVFMITAPVIYQSAIKVQLPKAKTGETTDKAPFRFSITKEGSVMWDQKPTNWDSLEKQLAQIDPKSIGEQVASISADQETAHGIVVRLMDTLRKAGLTRFALNVDSSPSK